MFAVILLQAAATDPDADTLKIAIDALTEAFSSQNLVLAVVCAVLVAALLVMKFLGKKVPLVDPIVKIVVGVARSVGTKKQPPVPGVAVVVSVKDGEPANDNKEGEPALSNVIDIKKDE